MQDLPTKEAILAALGKVQEPELHKDLVTLNMIRNLDIGVEKVSFTIMLTCRRRTPPRRSGARPRTWA